MITSPAQRALHTSGHIRGLDGLRAIAVIAVVWDHVYFGWEILPISRRGFLGVDVFFVLSGFLITWLLLLEQARTGKVSLGNFFVRRALRIFPLYFAVIGALAIYFYLAPDTSTQRAGFLAELPYHLTFTSNWIVPTSMMGITWSLATEEQFYLVWPVVFALTSAVAVRLSLVTAALIVNQIVNFGWLDSWFGSVGFPYHSLEIMQSTFTPLLLGVMAAHLVHNSQSRLAVQRALGAPVAMVALLMFLLSANWDGDIRGAPRLIIHLAVTVLIVWVFFNERSTAVRFLESRPLAYVGTISYGIYLLHLPVMYVAEIALRRVDLYSPVSLFVAGVVGSIVVAGLSYRYFERPILQLKRRFT
jgi:peptidoglycan/LPS O-acetylase OafA/YrhL